MKEEIEKLIEENTPMYNGIGDIQTYREGFNKAVEMYGISPSTVAEMIEALKEKEAKYVEWHKNMMINMRGEYDTAPNGEIKLIEEMIQHTAETIRDVREVLSKADKELKTPL